MWAWTPVHGVCGLDGRGCEAPRPLEYVVPNRDSHLVPLSHGLGVPGATPCEPITIYELIRSFGTLLFQRSIVDRNKDDVSAPNPCPCACSSQVIQ